MVKVTIKGYQKRWCSFEKGREYACPLGLKSEKHGLTIVSWKERNLIIYLIPL